MYYETRHFSVIYDAFWLMMIQKLFQLESRNVTYYVIIIENKTKIEQPQFASVDLHVY